MELDEFVKKSIEQIVDGVRLAQESKGVNVVNPEHTGTFMNETKHFKGNIFYDIDFDVAVTVQEKLDSNVGGKIAVLGMGVGAKMSEDKLSSTVTRLKFTVPVTYTDRKGRFE